MNRLAEQSPGFVGRLRSGESHGASTFWDGPCPAIVNISVWESYAALHAFGYRSPHGAYLRRRSRWFAPRPAPSAALWWVGPAECPAVAEAIRRLRFLSAHGPSPRSSRHVGATPRTVAS